MFKLACTLLALCYSIAVFADLPADSSHALSLLAPDGRWATRIEFRTNAYNSFYRSDTNREALGAPLHAVELDAQIFTPLVLFGTGATLGTTQFATDVSVRRVEITLGYGINEHLTVGLILPFGSTRTRANFQVSGGNVGFNPTFDPGQPVSSSNFPFAPVGMGASEPVGTAGVQSILSDPLFGYAYKPLGSTNWSGMGDPTLGLLWRFYQQEQSSFVFGFGYRFGLADQDDPDDLLDVPIDDGSNDLRFRLENYFSFGDGYDLKLQVEHDIQLSDHVTRRVPQPGELLSLASSKESLSRDMGDYWEYDLGLGKVIGDWRVSTTWHRYVKAADHYSSSKGTDTSALSANTDVFANQWRMAVSWSGIRSWQSGDLPLPLIVQLELQETYEARNFPDVRDIYLQLTSFF